MKPSTWALMGTLVSCGILLSWSFGGIQYVLTGHADIWGGVIVLLMGIEISLSQLHDSLHKAEISQHHRLFKIRKGSAGFRR